MSPRATQPRPIQFRAGDLAGPLAARQDDPGASLGRVAHQCIERYLALLAAELRRVDLSEAEAMLLLDRLNGVLHETPESIPTMLWAGVDDSIARDGLDRTWGVDGPALVAKLRALSPVQAVAVVDACERYWVTVGRGETPSPESVGLVRS